MSRSAHRSSERYFGIVFICLGCALSLLCYRIFHSLPLTIVFIGLGASATAVYYAAPASRGTMIDLFQTVTFPVRWAVTLTALAAVYYVVLTPIAIWYRWRGKSIRRSKMGSEADSESDPGWQRVELPADPESYFRTF